jgi:ribosomal protein S18 acetylase RimI-like enzyme
MRAGDMGQVVVIHLAAFPGFFLSFLGPSFLRLFYSEAVALGEICLVATAGGAVVGFVMGSAQPGGFFTKLIRRRVLGFGLAALPAVLRKPSTAARVVRALLKPKQAAKPEGMATLMSIGVDPGAQGLGAGKALVLAFVDEARRRGATGVDLTTDKLENDRTNAFYRSLGFAIAREIVTPEGRVLNEYELDLSHG